MLAAHNAIPMQHQNSNPESSPQVSMTPQFGVTLMQLRRLAGPKDGPERLGHWVFADHFLITTSRKRHMLKKLGSSGT